MQGPNRETHLSPHEVLAVVGIVGDVDEVHDVVSIRFLELVRNEHADTAHELESVSWGGDVGEGPIRDVHG